MHRDRYPELFQFFGAYFNQDWDLDAATPDGILDIFNREHSRDQRLQIADLIDALAAEIRDDQSLEQALHTEFGCDYAPEGDTRRWLKHVCARLRETN